MSDKKSTKKSQEKPKPAGIGIFQGQSRFGGGSGMPGLNSKSQYKPAPVRITQHKG